MSRANPPQVEQELRARLHTEQETPDVPDLLSSLAEVHDSGTHLALVYADGNAIASFIKALRSRLSRKRARRLDVAAAIDESVWDAVVHASRTILSPEDPLLPVIPHLVGGDDVLVSLPAHRAWRFAVTLQTRFDVAFRAASELGDAPSLSLGVVFHHYTHPLHMVFDLAESMLRGAKEHYLGARAALAWHDLDRDGVEPTARRPQSQRNLTDMWPQLDSLAAASPSSRHRLADIITEFGPDSDELTGHIQRFGLSAATPFLEPDSPMHLLDALSMTRWWWN